MTLAPRSWPSRPGLAMTTLSFRIDLNLLTLTVYPSRSDPNPPIPIPQMIGTSSYSPQTSRSASHISPTVA